MAERVRAIERLNSLISDIELTGDEARRLATVIGSDNFFDLMNLAEEQEQLRQNLARWASASISDVQEIHQAWVKYLAGWEDWHEGAASRIQQVLFDIIDRSGE